MTAAAEPISPPNPADDLAEKPRSVWRDGWTRLRRSKISMLCLGIVVFYALLGLLSFTPFFDERIEEHPDPAQESYQPPQLFNAQGHLTGPSMWFGLDIQGRSVFWRVLYGTRIALTITVLTSLIAIALGTILGLLAGYFGGWTDEIITWFYTTVSSVPWLLLVIAMAYVLRENPALQDLLGRQGIVILALGLTDWVGLCRLIRGEVIKLRERDYVVAARAIGARHPRIIFRHILPNTFHIIIITFSLGAISYVQAEVVLAFLGLGVTDQPSWGKMIDDAKLELLRGVWWQAAAATIAIFILCLALNLLGDALRDALDPRLRGVD